MRDGGCVMLGRLPHPASGSAAWIAIGPCARSCSRPVSPRSVRDLHAPERARGDPARGPLRAARGGQYLVPCRLGGRAAGAHRVPYETFTLPNGLEVILHE